MKTEHDPFLMVDLYHREVKGRGLLIKGVVQYGHADIGDEIRIDGYGDGTPINSTITDIECGNYDKKTKTVKKVSKEGVEYDHTVIMESIPLNSTHESPLSVVTILVRGVKCQEDRYAVHNHDPCPILIHSKNPATDVPSNDVAGRTRRAFHDSIASMDHPSLHGHTDFDFKFMVTADLYLKDYGSKVRDGVKGGFFKGQSFNTNPTKNIHCGPFEVYTTDWYGLMQLCRREQKAFTDWMNDIRLNYHRDFMIPSGTSNAFGEDGGRRPRNLPTMSGTSPALDRVMEDLIEYSATKFPSEMYDETMDKRIHQLGVPLMFIPVGYSSVEERKKEEIIEQPEMSLEKK